jgi:hypothetical protein
MMDSFPFPYNMQPWLIKPFVLAFHKFTTTALFQTTQMKLASFLLCILLHVLAHLNLKEDNNNLDHFLPTMFTLGLAIFNVFLPNVVVKERRVPFLSTHMSWG